MNEVLYKLYNGDYDPEQEPDEEWQNISQRLLELGGKIQDTMGLAFLDQWSNVQVEANDWRCCRCYQAGFCLGARLMLDVLTPS